MNPLCLDPLHRRLRGTLTRLACNHHIGPASFFPPIQPRPSPIVFNLTQRRTEVNLARTKRALKVAPHPSFAWSRRSSEEDEAEGDVIIFNPPSSAPSVYHTPYIFLPKSDPRRSDGLRRFFANADAESPGILSDNLADVAAPPSPLPLPPELNRPRRNPNYTLTPEQTQEMQRLRQMDPMRWSLQALAKKFGCSVRWVQIAAPGSEEHHARLEKQLQRVKSGWGPRKMQARTERDKRRQMLLLGLL